MTVIRTLEACEERRERQNCPLLEFLTVPDPDSPSRDRLRPEIDKWARDGRYDYATDDGRSHWRFAGPEHHILGRNSPYRDAPSNRIKISQAAHDLIHGTAAIALRPTMTVLCLAALNDRIDVEWETLDAIRRSDPRQSEGAFFEWINTLSICPWAEVARQSILSGLTFGEWSAEVQSHETELEADVRRGLRTLDGGVPVSERLRRQNRTQELELVPAEIESC